MTGRRRHEALSELGVFAARYLTYFGVRAVTEGTRIRARQRARPLAARAELGLAWEGRPGVVVGHALLLEAANAIYIYGHWPVLIVAGSLLFRFRREHYYSPAHVCLLTGLVGLFVFALFPVAPPRLTDLPLLDTFTRRGGLPADPAAVSREPVRRDAELPRRLEPRRGHRRLPRDPPLAAARVRRRRCRPRWRSPSWRPRTTSYRRDRGVALVLADRARWAGGRPPTSMRRH